MNRSVATLFFTLFALLVLPGGLAARVYSGTIDVNGGYDLRYFGFDYKKIAIPELNFSNLPAVNVYIRNPIVTDSAKNYWIHLSDPRNVLYGTGEVFIAFRVSKGCPTFDGTYCITVMPQINNAFDRTFFKAGALAINEVLGAFIVPRAMTLKKVKIQVITASAAGATGIHVLKSNGNNTPFVEVLSPAELSLAPGVYANQCGTFNATTDTWKENDLIRITVSQATPATTDVLITVVADYDN